MQQTNEVAVDPFDRLTVEEVGAVLPKGVEPAGTFLEEEEKVDSGGRGLGSSAKARRCNWER